nr:hypothetical protein [uncultured Carboxylicivirga sp.]
MKKKSMIILLLGLSLSVFSQTYDINGDYRIQGNVGIGITDPVQKLNISGGLRIGRPQHTLYHLDIVSNVISSGNVRYDFTVTDYQDREDETIMTINGQTGKIGIGITDPAQKFSINGGLRIARPEHALYHLDIVPNVISSGNVRYDFIVTDNQDREDETMLSINGQTGKIGIGTISPGYKLDVIGTIRAREIKVDLNGADFVFESGYKLRALEEVESYVKDNKHLPDIEPASKMEENGTELGELNSKLLQKIEELTLYMIDINKEVKTLKQENMVLKEKIEKLESVQ